MKMYELTIADKSYYELQIRLQPTALVTCCIFMSTDKQLQTWQQLNFWKALPHVNIYLCTILLLSKYIPGACYRLDLKFQCSERVSLSCRFDFGNQLFLSFRQNKIVIFS